MEVDGAGDLRVAEVAATAALVAPTRAADRRNGARRGPCITAVMWGLGRTPAYGAQKAASSGEVEAHETHSALRGPKQPPPGVCPAVSLTRGPQRRRPHDAVVYCL